MKLESLFPDKAFPKDQIPIIAGPCSIESRDQIRTTMRRLRESGYRVVRSGVWKPRTEPGHFEGVGEIGLQWMREAADDYGMLIGTEVCLPYQAVLALRYRCDFVWIGARTSTAPFLVDEIGKTLEGEDIAVLVKNPISPDFDLWRGAIRRLQQHGMTRLAAINRGFALGSKGLLRNIPLWYEVDRFRRELTDIPFLCDPSHISGDAALLPEVIDEACRHRYEGLFIESHYEPTTALTDAKQQITPEEIDTILPHSPLNGAAMLHRLRDAIDDIDDELISLLYQRSALTQEVGGWKESHRMELYQPTRRDEMIRDLRRRAELTGLSSDLVEELYTTIHHYSLAQQQDNKKQHEDSRDEDRPH